MIFPLLVGDRVSHLFPTLIIVKVFTGVRWREGVENREMVYGLHD